MSHSYTPRPSMSWPTTTAEMLADGMLLDVDEPLRAPDGALRRHRSQGKRAGRPRRLSAMLEISPRRCRKQKIPIRWI